ncbi:MAG: hypothetical protein NTW29_00305 [Bacteroidetes bacterium]|nr:hypothetical protein [Bacteroidota bacterium]
MKGFIYLILLLQIGCRQEVGKKIYTPFTRPAIVVYSDKPDEKYHYVLTPDTVDCRSFKEGRGLFAFLENKKCVVVSTGADLYLTAGKLNMWVCNLPKEKVYAGDTVRVSALVYEIFGDERTWGKPTIIHRISYKDESVPDKANP